MASRAIFYGALLLAAGCGNVRPERDSYDFSGQGPQTESAAHLWLGGPTTDAVFVHRRTHTLEHFTVEPYAHLRSLVLPLAPGRQCAWRGQGAQFYLTASDGDYVVLKADGSSGATNPLPMKGTITHVAFSPSKNLAVLTDDKQTLVFLTFAANGDVSGAWSTTAQAPNGQYVVAGAMLGSGQWAVTLSGGSIGLVDVAGSVAAQAWKLTTSDVAGATDMKWIGDLPGSDVAEAMILDSTRVLTVNLTNGTILDQRQLNTAKVLGAYRDLVPHLIVQPPSEVALNQNDVVYAGADGKITSATFQGSDSQITSSWLDQPSGLVAIAYDPELSPDIQFDPTQDDEARREIQRIKLTDGSVADTTEVHDRLDLTLRSGHLVGLYPSALGKAQRWTFGATPVIEEVSNFDFELAQARFKK